VPPTSRGTTAACSGRTPRRTRSSRGRSSRPGPARAGLRV
jgi:hypothetical protein